MNPRAEIYHYLAEILSGTPEWVVRPGKNWPLYRLALQLAEESPACRRALVEFGRIPAETLEQRRERYEDLFFGKTQPAIWLNESYYRSGRLVGPSTFQVEKVYEAAELCLASGELPDHASIELAFLSFLADASKTGTSEMRARARALEKTFIRKHAGHWMPEAARMMLQTRDLVYAPVGRFVAEWLGEALHARPRQISRKRVPILYRSADCTFCGFCTRACPTRALYLQENEEQTLLMLRETACTGCSQCVLVCETNALSMVPVIPGSPGRPQPEVLNQSARLLCKRCSTPMVSQAEISYVQAQIGHQPWLELCLECRTAP